MRSYWGWTTGGSRWRLAGGIGGPILAVLVAVSAIAGGEEEPPDGTSAGTGNGGVVASSPASGVEEMPEPTPTPQEPTATPEPPATVGTSADEDGGGQNGLAASIASLAVAPEDRTGYDRDLFGDYDRPALLAVNFAAWPACDGYYSLADDQCYTQASDVDVDHIVALGEAWDSGASAWSAAQHDEFAGDFDNLWLMTDNLNQSKSDRDIVEWIPPYQGAVCVYVEAYVVVKLEWNLSVDQAEKAALESLATGCDRAESPTTPPTNVPATSIPAPTTAPTEVQPTAPPAQYLPGDAYNCGDFDTYAEAKAYFDAVPGDPSRLDNDGDGIPCESLPGAP